jgi:DNA-binding LytR/AlgR family response regulator
MTGLRTIVVDDEPLARERLSRLLREMEIEVVAELEDGPDLLAWLRKREPVDAIFLDIQMPGGTGLEVLAEVPSSIPVIFVTAHSDHAVRAFDSEAVDYVLKPVFKDRLERAVGRLKSRLKQAGQSTESKGPPSGQHPRIPVRAGSGHVFLDLRKITHLEIEGDIVWAWSGGQRFRTPWGALSEVEAAFPGATLIRIQRHLLLRPEMVLAHRPLPGGRCEVRVGEGLNLEVSRSATPKLSEVLGLM